jgi:feruloyl esterase
MGHESASPLDPTFAIRAPGQPNAEAIVDFGHRATHLATTVGKSVIARYYGRPAQRAYWQGCSTGGRQGLAEVQRYPDDYDGVIAGAPVYTPLVYSNAILRVQAFHARPESNLFLAQCRHPETCAAARYEVTRC